MRQRLWLSAPRRLLLACVMMCVCDVCSNGFIVEYKCERLELATDASRICGVCALRCRCSTERVRDERVCGARAFVLSRPRSAVRAVEYEWRLRA